MQLAASTFVAVIGFVTPLCGAFAQSIRLSAPVTIVGAGSPALPNYWASMRLFPTAEGSLLIVRVGDGRIDKVLASGAIRPIGRVGDGPGEFRMISAAGLRGDTIWAVDEIHRRLTLFPRLGSGTTATKSLGKDAAGAPTFLPFVFADGKALALAITDEMKFDMNFAKHVPVVGTNELGVVDKPTSARESIDVWSRTHRIELPGPRSISLKPQLFSDRSVFGSSSNGRYLAIVNQSDVSQDPKARREISVLRVSGEQVGRFAVPFAAERLDRADRERLIDSVVSAMDAVLRARGNNGSIESAFRQNLFIPQLRTPVTDILVADDGTILLRGNDWGRATVTYQMLTSSGVSVGKFVVPTRQLVKAFTQTRVWSVLEDDSGQIAVISQQVLR